jgi:ribonuclease J
MSGYLKDLPDTVDFEDGDGPAARRSADRRHRRAGRGARGAGAHRRRQHPIKLEAGDVVLFSSRQIPGNEIAIGRIQNRLPDKGRADRHRPAEPDPRFRASRTARTEALYGWLRPQSWCRCMAKCATCANRRGLGQSLRHSPDGGPEERRSVRLAPGQAGQVRRSSLGPAGAGWRYHRARRRRGHRHAAPACRQRRW